MLLSLKCTYESLGISFECRFWSNKSQTSLRFRISNKLPGERGMGEHIWGWIFRVLSQGWEVENKAESIDIGHFLMTQGSYPGEGTEDALLTRVIRNPLVTAGGAPTSVEAQQWLPSAGQD